MGIFDKNISEEKRKSLEFAEAARETEWKYPSFVLKLFYGILDWDLLFPFPRQSEEDKAIGDDFIKKLETVLREKLNPDEVDRTGIIPDEVMKALTDIKAFAIKVPKEYGGLGLSQVNYNRAIHLVASYCGSTAVLLSAHQSIGAPQPLKLFGTKEQKEKYLPKFAEGTISAFALTEPEAGSDPRTMKTTAVPTEDGKHFIINGEKLWCTNGPIAGIIVVMAVTPPKMIHGKERKQITAFIVETDTPGVETIHRCLFMGLNGMQNGLMRFTDVKIPRENILLGEGAGLKLALMTLNTGRLTIPAASTGVGKWCMNVVRQWAVERKQWGGSIGDHESIALKLGYIASHTFAMEAITALASSMADNKDRDIRLEAAMAKHFSTIHAWNIANETLQIRGGQGYERSSSLKARGVKDWPVERVLRDIRINLIIEGTTEIMRLFIAREALDPHLSKVNPLLSSRTSIAEKLKALFLAAKYYVFWYPSLWMPTLSGIGKISQLPKPLRKHMRYAQRASKRLALYVFHRMMIYQKKLEAKQSILNRVVDIGVELFAISSVCSYAQSLQEDKEDKKNSVELADLFCHEARKRIEENFKAGCCNYDKKHINVAKKLMAGEYEWLENDIIK